MKQGGDKRGPWWSPIDRPWVAGAAIALIWSLVSVFAGVDGRWSGGSSLAVFDDGNLERSWSRDPNRRWAFVPATRFSAEESPGVWVEIEPGRAGHVQVQLSWRFDDAAEWSRSVRQHHLSHDWIYFDLSGEPGWHGTVGQLAVAILHDADFDVSRIIVEGHGATAAFGRGVRELFAVELFGGQSTVNVLYGPSLAGVALTVWVIVTLLLVAALELASARSTGRQFRWHGLMVAVALGWLVLDLRSRVNLAENVAVDQARFAGIAGADASATSYGDDFRKMVEGVLAAVPEDASFAFLSNDPFNVIRAKYLFFPRHSVGPLRLRNRRKPDYIVLYRVTTARLDEAKGLLTLDNGRRFQVEVVDFDRGWMVVRVLRMLRRVPVRGQPK